MLFLVLLIGATACGNNSGQSESGQNTIGRIEGNSGEDSAADVVDESVAEEAELGAETEARENTADGVGTADQAKTEQNDAALPELSSHVENMGAYHTTLLIYPKIEYGFNCVLCV